MQTELSLKIGPNRIRFYLLRDNVPYFLGRRRARLRCKNEKTIDFIKSDKPC